MTDLATRPDRPAVPLSVRAVNRGARLLSGRDPSRRRFLYRVAVVGSAMALNPMRFLLRPTPAYASVCGSGNTCDAGWSVFCCTINGGRNTCPAGSFVAGWWKVDNSAFCLGAPRFYIDCNRRPGSSCRCRCNSSGCDRRRVCCNVFRYGQCNTQIRGVTEVVCRIITCTPPWEWNRNCSRTVRVSESTRSHSARCLPGPNPTRIAIKYQDMGLVGSVLGKPTSRERDAARGGRRRNYERGVIMWHRTTGAHEVRNPYAKLYQSLGAAAGSLGYPKTDLRKVTGGSGWFIRFERGSIYRRKDKPARAVLASADRRFLALGGPRGRLGYPTTTTAPIKSGFSTRFEKGVIFHSPRTNAVEVVGAVLAVLRGRGGPSSSGLGFPVRPVLSFDDGGRWQRFENGMIAGRSERALFAVHGATATRYQRSGGRTGPFGYPISHTEGVAEGHRTRFQTVTVFWSASTDARWLNGRILRRYNTEGGPGGDLGFPTSDVETVDGVQTATFEGGTITYDPSTGTVTVVPNP